VRDRQALPHQTDRLLLHFCKEGRGVAKKRGDVREGGGTLSGAPAATEREEPTACDGSRRLGNEDKKRGLIEGAFGRPGEENASAAKGKFRYAYTGGGSKFFTTTLRGHQGVLQSAGAKSKGGGEERRVSTLKTGIRSSVQKGPASEGAHP